MCPLVGQPSRGYADYQRTVNYDSGVEWSLPPTNGPPTIGSPIIEVSRFARIAGRIGLNSGVCLVQWSWYLDALGSIEVGFRNYTMTALQGPYQQLMLSNMGPFVQVNLSAIAAGAFRAFATLYATNRDSSLESMPINSLLIDQQAIAIGAGGNAFVYPVDYFAGPCKCAMWIGQAGSQITFESLAQGGNWDQGPPIIFPAAATWTMFDLLAPAGAWRFQIGNPGAATNFYLIVVPSMTGAN